LIFEIQAFPRMACSTLHFFLVETWKMSEEISFDFLSLSHENFQKGVILPLPIEIVVEV
jgi:hypothetical protein